MAAVARPLLSGLAPLHCSARHASSYRPPCLRAFSAGPRPRETVGTRVAVIVVGAGPAGVATVGSLLDHLPPVSKVAWIDNKFEGGRINLRYREVPGNTRTKLFVDYARYTKALNDIVDSTPKPNAVTALEGLPGNDTCSLSYAGDAVSMLIDGLRKHPAVDARLGRVSKARWDPVKRLWTVVNVDSSGALAGTARQILHAPMLIYCTGASPTVASLPIANGVTLKPNHSSTKPARLNLDIALKPSILAQVLPSNPTTVGVIGASHSAILVLMNLWHLATTSPAHKNLKVKWFSRVPADGSLKYAEHKPEGWILWDNTGLKGRAAQFAKENLDNPEVLANSPVSSVIQRIDCSGGPENEMRAFSRHLTGHNDETDSSENTPCDFVIQAIGFTRDPLPATIIQNEPVNPIFDNNTGTFTAEATGKPLRGLHGAGIAFPERVTDPLGNVEHAVGFFKFAKFLKRVMPEWVSASCQDAPVSFVNYSKPDDDVVRSTTTSKQGREKKQGQGKQR